MEILLCLIFIYKHSFSVLFGRQCRFIPSCSAYAEAALRTHGAYEGSLLAARRLCRCHPFGGSGYDPVPQKTASSGPGRPRSSDNSLL